MPTPHVELQNITKRFTADRPPAVDRATFAVESGEIFGLLGPSGCGKTTTLRVMAGFEQPDEGDVLLDGRSILNLPPEKRRIGLVFQDYALLPNRTVRGNILFALHKLPRHQRRQRATELLNLVGLSSQADKTPDALSGGQQQRVALARALAADPEILLMDEPFSNLDAALRDSTRRDVRHLLRCADMTAMLVTHDQEEALSFCDRIAVMRDGRIEQIGKPEEIYMRPQTPFVAQFLGRANLLRGEAHGSFAETELGAIPIDREGEGTVLLSLRPEHLELERAGNAEHGQHPPAVVESREFRGHDLTYRVQYNGRTYVAHTEYTRSFYAGERVHLVPREPAVVLRQAGLCRATQSVPEQYQETAQTAGQADRSP